MPEVETYSSTNYANTNVISIDKPLGLAVGDLLVAHVCGIDSSPAGQTGPAGWEKRASDTVSGMAWSIFTKTATSGDVAATSFQFNSTATNYFGGSVIRLSGVLHTFDNVISSIGAAPPSGTFVTFADADMTPEPGSLILFLGMLQGAASGMMNYGCVNDNPTWTESYEFGTTSSNPDMAQSLAWAVRTPGTTTGDFFATKPGFPAMSAVFMAFAPDIPSLSPSASVSPSASRSPSASQSPSASVSSSPSPSISASRSPSASRSVSVSLSPSASVSSSASPSPSPNPNVFNTSIITAVTRVKQNLAFPQFVIGGKGGEGGNTYALFKKTDVTGFSVFRTPVFRIGRDFDVMGIRFSVTPSIGPNMNLLPVLYFDNESVVSVGNQINSAKYPNGESYIKLNSKNFNNGTHGKSNVFLEFRWLGNELLTVVLPIILEMEVSDV